MSFVYDGDFLAEWRITWTKVQVKYPQANRYCLCRRMLPSDHGSESIWVYGIDVYGGKTLPEGFHVWTSGRFRTWDEWAYIPESANWVPGCPEEEGSYLLYYRSHDRKYLSLAKTQIAAGVVKVVRTKLASKSLGLLKSEIEEIVAPVLKIFVYDCLFDRKVRQTVEISGAEVLRWIRLVKIGF